MYQYLIQQKITQWVFLVSARLPRWNSAAQGWSSSDGWRGKVGPCRPAASCAQAALNWRLGCWNGNTASSKQQRKQLWKVPQSTESLSLTLKDCMSSLSLQREIKILRLFWCLKVGRIIMNLCALLHLYFRFVWYLLRRSVYHHFFFLSGIRKKTSPFIRVRPRSVQNYT